MEVTSECAEPDAKSMFKTGVPSLIHAATKLRKKRQPGIGPAVVGRNLGTEIESIGLIRRTLARLATLRPGLAAATAARTLLATSRTPGASRTSRTPTATLLLQLFIFRELVRCQDPLDLGRGGRPNLGHLSPSLFRGQVRVLTQGTLLIHLILQDVADLCRLVLGGPNLLQPRIALGSCTLATIRTTATAAGTATGRRGRLVAICP